MATAALPNDEDSRRDALTGSIQWQYAARNQLGRVQAAQDTVRLTRSRAEHLMKIDDEYRQPFLALAADRHFLLVALANLIHGLDLLSALGAQLPTFEPVEAERIRLLRNIFEHWDDAVRRSPQPSLTRFADAFPGQDPGHHQWSVDGSRDEIGGLKLIELAELLATVRTSLLTLEAGHFVWRGI